jgi:hypothetical protein
MRSRIAWSLFGLSVVVAAAAFALWVPTRSLEVSEITSERAAEPGLIVAFLFYAAVGSLIVSRRFGNRVGWLFLVTGLVFELGLLMQEYAVYALRYAPGSPPGGAWAGLFAEFLPIVAIGISGTFLLLIYPTGNLPSRRWRPVVWLAASSTLVVLLTTAFEPGRLTSVEGAAKPVEIDFPLFTGGEWAWPAMLFSGILAIVSVVVRYRRAGALERQQLRWFVAAVPIFVTSIFWVPAPDFAAAVVSLGLASLPIAAGIAILRYRLYDIDVIIRRTLVYGIVTAGLGGLYFAIVLALQQAFSGFAGGSDLAVAGSTLAVAALFRPVRNRVQALVDRRFYRRRYDTQRTLEAFSARLRDEIDLGTLRRELLQVVDETMRPANLSLWLRGGRTDQ